MTKAKRLSLYFRYRFGMVAAFGCFSILGLLFKESDVAIRFILFLMAASMCLVQSWSMTLGPYISHAYLVWLPVIIFASYARSFILPALSLVLLVCVSKVFWGPYTEQRFLVSDTMIGLFVLFGSHLVRSIWIEGRALKLRNDDLIQESFLLQQTFDKQIRSFISPVLIKKIEKMMSKGSGFIAAVDSVLRLHRTQVAVMYSDIRNYSTRSDDIDFIEKELIPSARSIIDPAEENGGVAKQIGDAVLVYYSFDDPEEGLLRALKDGLRSSLLEDQRIRSIGRSKPERYFTITFGIAYIGNIASARHREPTITGRPANLSARIDTLTKERAVQDKIAGQCGILLDEAAAAVVKTFTSGWMMVEIILEECSISIRSYPEEKKIYFLPASKVNLEQLNGVLRVNKISELFPGKNNG